MAPAVAIPVPPMPAPILIGTTGLSGALLLAVCLFVRNNYVRALAFAFWFRYVLSAWHPITFPPSVGGLSINAIGSCAVIALTVVLLGPRALFHRYAWAFLVFLLAIVLSAGVNGRAAGGINAVIKLSYLLCIANLTYHAIRTAGVETTMKVVATSFFLPVVEQWISVAIGLKKMSELDGSGSFIGGFAHEAAFSIMLVTFLFAAVFLRRPSVSSLLCLMIGLVGLVLANYRTAMLAVIPILICYLMTTSTAPIRRDQRPAALVIALLIVAAAGSVLVLLAADRLQDIATALSKGASLIKPPEYFTRDEQQLFSGRAYIWSAYLTAWLRGDVWATLFGFGPDAWQGVFVIYAHNTFVSILYEDGLLGLIGLCIVFADYVARGIASRGPERTLAVYASTSFLLLNFATMPLWQVEGNLLFGILLGHSWYLHAASARRSLGPLGSAPMGRRLPNPSEYGAPDIAAR
ncbi:O-antigen ligase [Methylorubrum rhodesianum]|uniref:O-antigen ligase family protein n=1 Tax=Methylorubrum TaxID=2282523 RepID=UPI0016180134|nr:MULTISPECIES: O-antigen ligase family protein [Methylorubrum]MBB5765746.1 O-antigen ligase [Methylorubrum rhodesianum]MBI1691996.1 O-antigen ligase domain-containing protein [Methylorubrum sp. DB1722]